MWRPAVECLPKQAPPSTGHKPPSLGAVVSPHCKPCDRIKCWHEPKVRKQNYAAWYRTTVPLHETQTGCLRRLSSPPAFLLKLCDENGLAKSTIEAHTSTAHSSLNSPTKTHFNKHCISYGSGRKLQQCWHLFTFFAGAFTATRWLHCCPMWWHAMHGA